MAVYVDDAASNIPITSTEKGANGQTIPAHDATEELGIGGRRRR